MGVEVGVGDSVGVGVEITDVSTVSVTAVSSTFWLHPAVRHNKAAAIITAAIKVINLSVLIFFADRLVALGCTDVYAFSVTLKCIYRSELV